MVAGTLSEEHLTKVMGKGLNEFKKMGANLAHHKRNMTFDFGRDKIPFLMTSSLFSICFGIIFSQRTTFVKTWQNSNVLVYGLLFMETVVSALIYVAAGKEDQKGLQIGHGLLLVFMASLLLSVHFLNLPLIIIAYIFSGLFWPFLNIFYNSYGLGFSEELLGANLAVRSFSYMMGSLLGGVLVESQGFFIAFLIGTLSALLAPLPFFIGKWRMNKNINVETQS